MAIDEAVDMTGARNAKSRIAFGVSDRSALRTLVWARMSM
jgi:hypothetical protein